MAHDKNFKRLVRTRMKETGESYTTARSKLKIPGSHVYSPDPEGKCIACHQPENYFRHWTEK